MILIYEFKKTKHKFKAKNKNNEWVYWSIEDEKQKDINNKTICQFSGLTDKDGNEIYENDLMDFAYYYQECNKVINLNCICEFKGGMFNLFSTKLINNKKWRVDYNEYINFGEVKITGNIFDKL